MIAPARQRIRAAFGGANDYDRHSRVQRDVAQALAETIAALPLPMAPRILEIGCGTGHLTRALYDRGVRGQWLVTDIAPAMVERCHRRMGDAAGMNFAVLDGDADQPAIHETYDLICSSLALQWFDDPETAVRRMLGWLAPGGTLAFTSLLEGTFREWREAHAATDQIAGTRPLAGRKVYDDLLPEAQLRPHRVFRLTERHDHARAFLRALRAIGADTPAPAHRPLGPGAMRRVMREFAARGGSVTYEVIECLYGRED